ncbi:acetoacetate decarboxylase [Phormidesmis priestleyi ULC007]|uniref:Acetoacetate decarboxylase n=1 Tax=Phormidesmis priestleyi ULC007 TaxID=1920490 RepID=A0A2T1DEX0_9CYAN|nr:acetoacetate decarboxylase family protein [Phormidesmis priestleyi]PSB19026.1 acetoacetate decarboxylase [Phormidesmis priestleyi ULC007]PZO54014.1 MAG: acetoacetate decarboxylase [Phormidesmis priestleyi]
MSYPQAPWTLKGFAFQTLHLIDIAKASPFIPPELAIVSAAPDKTLGGVYFSQYGTGSSLEYNELIVVAGVVRREQTIGAWVSHIYVDNPDSVAGGREIWGMPKELATFDWQAGAQRVVVQQDDRVLCSLSSSWRVSLVRQAIAFPVYSLLNSNFLRFNATASANFGWIGAKLEVPEVSPFASVIDTMPISAFSADSLELRVDGPRVVA